MKTLSSEDLKTFQDAILKDYGVKIEDKDLYQAAFGLLGFVETLIKFELEKQTSQSKGSKVVQENLLTTSENKHNIE